MTFISYAQNFEDVMLRRALQDVRTGFYIDVGAQDPVVDSVTRTFYEQGWRGINIEPVAEWHEKLEADRPHDANLRLALGAAEGEVTLFEIPDTGLSTTDPDLAARHERAGRGARAYTVRATTLDAICREQGVTTVHFLKIDVEGAERAVLEGFSFGVRPWIVLVEATLPNSQEPAYADWEPLLIDRGYRLVYQDGLNRFYLDEAHAERAAAFASPPNVFDRFVRYPEWRAKVELQQARDAHAQLAAVQQLGDARERAAAAEAARGAAEAARAVAERSLADARAVSEAARATAERSLADARAVSEDLRSSVAAWTEVARTRESHILEVELRLRNTEQQVRDALAAREQLDRQLEQARQVAARVPELEEERTRLWAERDRLGEQMSQRECELAELRHAMDVLYASHSWRVTRPMRDARRHAARAVAMVRGVARRVVRWPLALALSWAPLRAIGRRLLAGRPELAERLLRLGGAVSTPAEQPAPPPAPPLVLTPRAHAILRAMRAVESGHDGGA